MLMNPTGPETQPFLGSDTNWLPDTQRLPFTIKLAPVAIVKVRYAEGVT